MFVTHKLLTLQTPLESRPLSRGVRSTGLFTSAGGPLFIEGDVSRYGETAHLDDIQNHPLADWKKNFKRMFFFKFYVLSILKPYKIVFF
jgi:hypothetical protein